MTSSDAWEALAAAIFAAAIREKRAGELLDELFIGGSATVDEHGNLVIMPVSQVEGLLDHVQEES